MELCPEKHRHRQCRIGQGRGDHIDGEHLRCKSRQFFPVIHIAGAFPHRIGGDAKACKQQKIPADGACKVHFAQVFHLKNIGRIRKGDQREDNIHQCFECAHRCIQAQRFFHIAESPTGFPRISLFAVLLILQNKFPSWYHSSYQISARSSLCDIINL